jgi:hypothetical protein
MKGTVWGALSRFWASDYGLSIFLALLIVLVFVQPLLRSIGTVGLVSGDVIFSLLLMSGAVVVPQRRPMLIVTSVAVAAALFIRWATWVVPSVSLSELRSLASLVCYGLITLLVLAQVFRAGPVTAHRIQGAIAVYLLLGLSWAATYELLSLVRPGAFAGSGMEGDTSRSWTYYSFVTLTTVGYGDITPVHPLARSLAVFEALTGQLYPAILLARLVSLEVQSKGSG